MEGDGPPSPRGRVVCVGFLARRHILTCGFGFLTACSLNAEQLRLMSNANRISGLISKRMVPAREGGGTGESQFRGNGLERQVAGEQRLDFTKTGLIDIRVN